MMRALVILFAALLVGSCTHHDSASVTGAAVGLTSFAALNANVIASKCVSCHSGTSPAGGMDFSTYEGLMRTGSVVAGKPLASSFLTSVTSGQMPPGAKLSYDLVQSIENWIQSGAKRDAALTIAKLTPATALNGQQVSVTISGEGLQSNCSVYFGGQAGASIIFNSSNQISVVSPVLAPGSYDVKVTNPDGVSMTMAGAFTVSASDSGSALSVTKVFPNNGVGGTFIELTGTGFLDGTKVTVGSQPCGGILVNPPNQITCTVPRNDQSGPVNVVVTNPDSTSLPFLNGFTYTVAASFTSILNNILVPKCTSCHGAALARGGIRLNTYANVMATGVVIPRDPTNSVLFADVQTKKEPRSPSTQPALTDAELATVYNWILNGAYDDTPPTVSSITPAIGSTLGGSAVRIVGTGFFPGITVNLGSAACTPAQVDVTGKIIDCVTSPRGAGTVDIVVINAPSAGVTPLPSTTGTSLYIYAEPPLLTSITPRTIKSSATGNVTIAGRNLKAASVYRFGNVNAVSQLAPACNPTTLDCTVSVRPPNQAASVVTVRVTNPDGQFFDLVDGLVYSTGDPPTVTDFSPKFTYTGRTPTMTITGTGFLAGATVTFGGRACTNPSVGSPTTITCGFSSTNLTAGPNPLVVTNPDNLKSTEVFNIDLRQTLTIDTITPATATLPVGGGVVTVAGKGIVNGATLTLGGNTCPSLQYNENTNGQILSVSCSTGPAPNLAAQSANIVLSNPPDGPGGTSGEVLTASINFAFVLPTSITLTSVAPNTGVVAGGTTIVITGTGFAKNAVTTIGGQTCTSPTVTATTITCTTPAGASYGPKNIVVTNTNAVTKTLTGGFTYSLPTAINITGVSPNTGPVAGGTPIVITATGIAPGATVTVGGVACTSPSTTGNFPTSVSCTTPSGGATGAVDVVVRNTDNVTGTAVGGFTYQ